MHPRLQKIRIQLEGGEVSPSVSIRKFLSWFGAQRRGQAIVDAIRDELEDAGLTTSPDFEGEWIDSEIEFKMVEEEYSETPEHIIAVGALAEDAERICNIAAESSFELEKIPIPTLNLEDATPAVTREQFAKVARDPTYRISKLEAANQGILSVKPSASLQEVITRMMVRDFSQIPVMTNDRDVRGMITWKSIVRHTQVVHPEKTDLTANDLLDPSYEISSTFSIFDAITTIVTHDYVLERGTDKKITGIITSSDLSLQFRELTEPFLLLSEIENNIRDIMETRFSAEELEAACGAHEEGRKIEGIDDLSFGEYIRILQNPGNWDKIGLYVDRNIFCADLDEVRRIRNDVMHFDPDGISRDDLRQLRQFSYFLKQVRS